MASDEELSELARTVLEIEMRTKGRDAVRAAEVILNRTWPVEKKEPIQIHLTWEIVRLAARRAGIFGEDVIDASLGGNPNTQEGMGRPLLTDGEVPLPADPEDKVK